eukprot:g32791.t1
MANWRPPLINLVVVPSLLPAPLFYIFHWKSHMLVAVIVPDILIWVAGGAVFAAHWDTSKTVSSSSSDVMNVYHERPILPMT